VLQYVSLYLFYPGFPGSTLVYQELL